MAAMVLFKAATKRGCWFNRMVMTAPMVKILGLPMPQMVCEQVADGLTLFGLGDARRPGRRRHSGSAARSPSTQSDFIAGALL